MQQRKAELNVGRMKSSLFSGVKQAAAGLKASGKQ
jgi:hypothetical protein